MITDQVYSASTVGIDETVVSTQHRNLLRLATHTVGGAANEAERVEVLFYCEVRCYPGVHNSNGLGRV